MNIMLVASKKTNRKWLLPECPTLDSWIGIVTEIYRLEQLAAHVNQSMEAVTGGVWTQLQYKGLKQW